MVYLYAGDLPYMLALDRPTKSIVVAIRGTVSVADLATDMLADPEPMEEWLPDTMTQVSLHDVCLLMPPNIP